MTGTVRDAEERATARMRQLLPRLIDTQARIAALQAEQERLLAEAHRVADEWAAHTATGISRDAELPYRSVAAEVATVWRVSDRTVQRRMGTAVTLVDDYPETLASLQAGRIGRGHVRVIETAGAIIDDRRCGALSSETSSTTRRARRPPGWPPSRSVAPSGTPARP
ncbi:DUF222 domain-containing protein [Microbacterium sp.]|uniref:DUF222 domain-containing protein n=1 Tax=Microbacterium sp. TaxID=51671 RepID=UPI003A8490A3